MSAFNPSPAEIALTSNIFNIADPQKLGIVTGDTAVKVLSGAKLSHVVLGEVWAIADKENNGFLTRKGVAIALRLIGHAQNGESVNEDLLHKPGPLAHIDGIPGPAVAGSPAPSSPVPKPSPSRQGSTLPPITQQDKTKFLKLFIGCGPVNGLLNGEKARDVFVKSKLPYERLSQIWTLADTKSRGALDSTDFTIGMYLIQASMSSASLTLPASLPGWIYDQAAQKDSNMGVASHATGGSASGFGSPMQTSFQIPRQYTGSGATALSPGAIKPQSYNQYQVHPNVPPTSPSTNVTFRGAQLEAQWDVSPEAKSTSDKFFDSLDTQRRGYIEGDVAVPFMLESKLSEDDLARIWDLADLQNDGRLNREGFAVAMHLINSKLAGVEIPAVIPPSLVPPSMRPAQNPVTIATQLDLLGDDTPPSSAVPPQPTGGSAFSAPVSSHNTGPLQSAFAPSRQPSAFLPAVNKDLLGDDDDEPSKNNSVPDNSAEIGNLQNQVASTTRSHSTTQTERISVEQAVAQQASQLSQLQTQLSAAKASYETESRLLGTLRERLTTQRVDIQKAQEEFIRAESDLSATKVEKAEVEGSVLRDKEEIRDLQRKMKEVADETDGLKSSIEKAKKDARQQKGLLAIAKKQLATAEAERLKVSKELEVAQKELEVAQKEKENLDTHIANLGTAPPPSLPVDTMDTVRIASPEPSAFAAEIPLPDTPAITPQPSGSRQSTNPFERLAMASASTGGSPFLTSLPQTETKAAEKMAFSPDLFTSSISSSDPSSGQPKAPGQSSVGSEDLNGAPKPSIDPSTAMHTGSSPPMSALSPSDDALFHTPPSTGNLSERGNKSPTSPREKSFSEAFPELDGDGVLKPLQEVENDESDTSDSDNEPLGTKILSKKAEPVGIDSTHTPTMSSVPVPDVEQPSSHAQSTFDDSFGSPRDLTASSHAQPTFDDSFSSPRELSASPMATRISPPTSGKSSPRRSRSPGQRALSTRTLSTHSISGAMDPFGASTFSQTPLEPPAGEAAPPPTIETVLEPSGAPVNASSINDFDEALGKIPNAKEPAPFTFDSAFDDNFDFSSSVNGNADVAVHSPNENGMGAGFTTGTPFSTFPPVSSPMAQPPTSTIPGQTSGTAMSFGEAFAPRSPVAPMNGGSAQGVSFDDAFGLKADEQPHANGQPPTSNGNGFPINNATTVGSQESAIAISPFPPPSSPPIPPRSQPSPPPVREASPAIRPASPQQQPHQPRFSSGTSRGSSPPPQRASSPRLRALSGSKASSENKSDGPSRHKLSIRFPFGRKDKSKDKEDKRAQSQAHQLIEQQQFLSPVSEPPLPGAVTPAVEDDAEPVKQLAAMGFSRTQSIAALETHGYDMQKALNSLLGAA